jgi:hypothetical protein
MERQVAFANSDRWKKLIQLQIYYFNQNPALGQKYASVTAGTAVINQKLKLPRVTIAALTAALEQTAIEMMEQRISEIKFDQTML